MREIFSYAPPSGIKIFLLRVFLKYHQNIKILAARQYKNPVNLFSSRYFFATTPRACAISLLIDSLDFPSLVTTRFCSTSLSIDFLSTFFFSSSTFDSSSFSLSFFLPSVVPHRDGRVHRRQFHRQLDHEKPRDVPHTSQVSCAILCVADAHD